MALLLHFEPFDELEFADKMMSYAYNQFMPAGTTWRDLFDMVQLYLQPCTAYCTHASLYSRLAI